MTLSLEQPDVIVEARVHPGDNTPHSGAERAAFSIRHDRQSLDRVTPQNARLEPVATDLVTVVGGSAKTESSRRDKG